jgi:hypothetical protein
MASSSITSVPCHACCLHLLHHGVTLCAEGQEHEREGNGSSGEGCRGREWGPGIGIWTGGLRQVCVGSGLLSEYMHVDSELQSTCEGNGL